MAEQIMSELGNYVGSNIFALLLVVIAAAWPKVARVLFSVLFLGAGVWNLFASFTMPAFYVATYGHLATPPYAAFIFGPFAANPALFVVPIALGQLTIGVLAMGTGMRVRLAMIGVTAFMIGLAPLGVGGAFPFSLFAIVAAYLVFRTPFQASLSADVELVLAVIAHGFQLRGQARPHS
jgi:hypothetical protein